MTRRQLGYNLVEVLIATALLGVVVLSISTLFVMGRRNIYSGKQTTAAVAVGTRVMEDLSTLSLDEAVAFFDLTTAAPATNNVAGKAYTNSVKVTTSPLTSISNANGAAYLTSWAGLLTSDKFSDGKLTLVFEPYKGSAAVTDATIGVNANILKVRTIVEWKESSRPRKIILDTVKVDRSK